MKKEKKMNLIELMDEAKNFHGCTYVKIVNNSCIPGTDVKEVIYMEKIEDAVSADNKALMLLNYLDYETWTIEYDYILVVKCDLRKVGE